MLNCVSSYPVCICREDLTAGRKSPFAFFKKGKEQTSSEYIVCRLSVIRCSYVFVVQQQVALVDRSVDLYS